MQLEEKKFQNIQKISQKFHQLDALHGCHPVLLQLELGHGREDQADQREQHKQSRRKGQHFGTQRGAGVFEECPNNETGLTEPDLLDF